MNPHYTDFWEQGSLYVMGLATLRQVLRDADASPQVYRQLFAELQAWDIDNNFVQVLKMERVLNGIVLFNTLQSMPFNELLKELSILEENEVNLAPWLGSHFYISTNQLVVLKHFALAIDIAGNGAPYDENALKQLEQEKQKLGALNGKFRSATGQLFGIPINLR